MFTYPVTNDPRIDAFLRKEVRHCILNGIKVELSPTEVLTDMNGLQTSGWFDEKWLKVAAGGPVMDWLSTFAHETCHKDQFLEGHPTWDTKINGVCALETLEQWLLHKVEVHPQYMDQIIRKAQAVELDCEIRTIKKLRDNHISFNGSEYIKAANVYVWYYRSLPITRQWKAAPYAYKPMLDIMPAHFDNDYSTLPPGFMDKIEEYNALD